MHLSLSLSLSLYICIYIYIYIIYIYIYIYFRIVWKRCALKSGGEFADFQFRTAFMDRVLAALLNMFKNLLSMRIFPPIMCMT